MLPLDTYHISMELFAWVFLGGEFAILVEQDQRDENLCAFLFLVTLRMVTRLNTWGLVQTRGRK